MLYKFLDTSIKDWRAHCKKCFVSSRKQTTHKHLGIERMFEHLCFSQTILIATDNTTVVSCINKYEIRLCVPSLGGCSPATSSDILACYNCMIENELSRHRQIYQSLFQESFNQICNWWHSPNVDLFTTRYNKPAQFVSQLMLSACLWRVGIYDFPSVPCGQSGQQNHEPQI